MTFVGKLLVILQLVLSICFMGFAGVVYSRHVSWKAEYEQKTTELDQQKKQSEAERNDAQKRLTEETQKTKAAEQRAQDAENALSQEKMAGDTLRQTVDRLNTELGTQRALANSTQEEADIRRNEARLLTQINDTLNKELNLKNTKVRALEDELFTREIEIKNLTQKHDNLLEHVAIFTKVLASNGFSTDPKSYSRINAPIPLVFGRVEDVQAKQRNGRELVQISIGSDDGLQEGTVLYIYRIGERNQYLGQIKLELVKPDQAVGVVVQGTKNGVIEKGDYVSTKL